MIRRLILAGALLGGALAAAGVLAQPRPPAGDIAVGTTVIDAEGAPLGQVEALVRDAEGRPQQVLIRTGGPGPRAQLKSLPISSLRPRDGGFAAPLRKAEFDLLPTVQRR